MSNEETKTPNQIDIHGITELLPHRYPFLLVDRILDYTPQKSIIGIKNVTINEPFFIGHFPERPVMPGVLILEALAQTGGVLIMQEYENIQDYVIFLMTMDKVKFRKPVIPGDQLRMEIEVLMFRRNTAKLATKGYVDGKLVASAEMTSMLIKKDEKR